MMVSKSISMDLRQIMEVNAAIERGVNDKFSHFVCEAIDDKLKTLGD